MKKFLVLGLILAIAGGAFAQSFTIGGGISTGLAVQFDAEDVQARMRRAGDHNGIRIDLTGEAVNADGTIGANIGLRWDDIVFVGWSTGVPADGGSYLHFIPDVKTANVWIALIPSVLRFSLGMGGPGGFDTPGPIGESLDVAGGDMNITALINPVPQVTIGATVNLPPLTAIGGEHIFDLEGDIYYSLGVSVNLDNIANFAFNFQQKFEDGTISLATGFDILALRVVTFAFDGSITDITGNPYLSLGQAINLNFGNFGASLRGRQFLNLKDDEFGENPGMAMLFDANLHYSFGAVTPGLGVGFGYNTSRDREGFYDSIRADSLSSTPAVLADPDVDGKYVAMIFNPNVVFNFGPSALEIGYSMYFDFGEFGDPPEPPTFFNSLYLAYKYSF